LKLIESEFLFFIDLLLKPLYLVLIVRILKYQIIQTIDEKVIMTLHVDVQQDHAAAQEDNIHLEILIDVKVWVTVLLKENKLLKKLKLKTMKI
jgi:hypothetical protein